jgi:hypothetical protein
MSNEAKTLLRTGLVSLFVLNWLYWPPLLVVSLTALAMVISATPHIKERAARNAVYAANTSS